MSLLKVLIPSTVKNALSRAPREALPGTVKSTSPTTENGYENFVLTA